MGRKWFLDTATNIEDNIGYCTFASVAVTVVAILADTVVAAHSVDTSGMLVADMVASRTFVEFSAIELVNPVVTRKTLARVGADHVDAFRVGVAVVTLGATLLLALVYV